MSAVTPRSVVALTAGVLLAWAASSCGSEGSGTVASQARDAASVARTATQPTTESATTPTTTQPRAKTTTAETRTVTQPAQTQTQTQTVTKTTTVTQPAETQTVTATATVTQPTTTSTTATVAVLPAPTTAGDDSGDGPLPWWGWLLIALGAVAAGFGIYRLGRRGGRPTAGE